ncbi:hypothetical protein [Streptomyces sp. NPDC048436]|uniref:hypothetical protein n=1 Tax=Streptomyces sp. NPDC048436 TaxID=3365550 RepID=UPI00371D0E63
MGEPLGSASCGATDATDTADAADTADATGAADATDATDVAVMAAAPPRQLTQLTRAQAASPAEASAEPVAQQPTCAAPDSGGFPIRTRIKGGPAAYEAGGGYRTWSLKLTNTTRGTCGDIHPVVVIVDRERELLPRQIQLDFHDGERWRPVGFERTDRDENVGVFDDGFPGFRVKAGHTLTAKVRLSFTSAARSEHAVISAAVVQRRDDDGDWVGESDDYPFGIDVEGSEDGSGDASGDERDDGGARDAGRDGGSDPGGHGYGRGDSGRHERTDAGGFSYADELAATGPRALLGAGAVAAALFAGGWGLVVATRRLRAGRGR